MITKELRDDLMSKYTTKVTYCRSYNSKYKAFEFWSMLNQNTYKVMNLKEAKIKMPI